MMLKKRFNLRKIQKKKKFLLLAYDQGMEHGPIDFNDKNIDPKYVIDIAKKGKFTGIIFQKGIAEKYNAEIRKSKVPLIVKLNGKTSLVRGDPISRQLCTVEEARALGAVAVGFTIYIGSIHEEKMLVEFEKIQRNAHKIGLPVICWMYPRGKGIKGKKNDYLAAYGARIALEIGADIVKIHFDGKKKDMEWVVKSAGKTRVIFAGGAKENETILLKTIKNQISAGASGLAIGRNIWQNETPIKIANKVRKILYSK
jgi:fructose-bisphosphate aldolase, class I